MFSFLGCSEECPIPPQTKKQIVRVTEHHSVLIKFENDIEYTYDHNDFIRIQRYIYRVWRERFPEEALSLLNNCLSGVFYIVEAELSAGCAGAFGCIASSDHQCFFKEDNFDNHFVSYIWEQEYTRPNLGTFIHEYLHQALLCTRGDSDSHHESFDVWEYPTQPNSIFWDVYKREMTEGNADFWQQWGEERLSTND